MFNSRVHIVGGRNLVDSEADMYGLNTSTDLRFRAPNSVGQIQTKTSAGHEIRVDISHVSDAPSGGSEEEATTLHKVVRIAAD